MIPDLSPLAEHAARLDGHRPERLHEVHQRIDVARRRRRRTATGAAAAGVAAILAAVALTAGVGDHRGAEPVEQPDGGPVRPLTYAVGETIHYGERTIDVGEEVQFLAVSDDGVAFVKEPRSSQPGDDKALWFTDGLTVKRIGTTSGSPARGYDVRFGETGSLLVVGGQGDDAGNHIVIDTRTGYLTHRERSTFADRSVLVLGVADDTVDFVFTRDSACQLEGDRACLRHEEVVRYSVSRHDHTFLSWDEYDVELRSRARTLVGPDRGTPPVPGTFVVRDPFFQRQGEELVAIDYDGVTQTALRDASTGDAVRLRVPAGATEATRFSFSQWLDDDRFVLFAYTGLHGAADDGSEMADEGDIFVCALSTGSCRLELKGEPGTAYQLPALD